MHRVAMEKKLGRKLEKGEIVHHIDGNKLNNEASNLLVTTQSEHCKLHKRVGGRWACS
jgi:HNH endonuclease.